MFSRPPPSISRLHPLAREQGVDEIGLDTATNRVLVRINPKYFRPAEVDTLLGNASKAKAVLGWEPKLSFEDLVREMIQEDCSKNITYQYGVRVDCSRVLVTGGSGLLGSAIQTIANKAFPEPHFHFSSSKECNLMNQDEVIQLFKRIQPTHVIHLAADVGGLFKNMRQPYDMFSNNVRMNLNVINTAHACGVQNLVACLSTCVFPDKLTKTKILTEEDLHLGPPHDSNYGYAHAKWLGDILCRTIREQHGRNYFCVTPTNLFGPMDNFNLENAHVIPALIHKAYLAQKQRLLFEMESRCSACC